jgi:hypothetical protein
MLIELFLAYICTTSGCYDDTIVMSPEATAIAMCESGDTQTLGSLDWNATNVNRDNTIDRGAFQFNGYWIWNPHDRWIMRPFANSIGMSSDALFHAWPTAGDAPPRVQVALFEYLWDNGRGWRHWAASRACWGKYISVGG